ncbi:cytochrome b/b6 domain-containing protein [Alteromonas sp. H39]|uniref:cytochrome b/b6 domain-containing protein n=1 Tax=Alteromonas sp. H39 TaxID=3389876 RepID=UPI0039DFF1B3
MEKRMIWDIPTRLFHWLLVASLSIQYATAEWLDDAMQWHFYVGYFTIGLVIFRLIWGFIGPEHARFRHFLKGPTAIISYMRSLPDKHAVPHAGHNPLGGVFVIVMLLLIAIQAVSGLFLTDEVFLDGPYRHLVSDSTQDVMSTLHHQVIDALLIVIALHIAAIAFYAVYKKQSLTSAMIHGKKATSSQGITSSRLLLAVVVAAIVAALVYLGIDILPPEPVDEGFYY